MLGHASVRTTALYWQNIYQEPDGEIGPILAGKFWLERKKPPTTENFPETLETPKPTFIVNEPVIPNKKPIQQDNSLSVQKTLKKTSGMLINPISPKKQEKFLLNNPNKKTDQLKISQPLAMTPNKDQKPTEKEFILLQKIKHLEEQLKQTQELAEKEKKRADNYQQQLKVIVKSLYQ